MSRRSSPACSSGQRRLLPTKTRRRRSVRGASLAPLWARLPRPGAEASAHGARNRLSRHQVLQHASDPVCCLIQTDAPLLVLLSAAEGCHLTSSAEEQQRQAGALFSALLSAPEGVSPDVAVRRSSSTRRAGWRGSGRRRWSACASGSGRSASAPARSPGKRRSLKGAALRHR